MSKAYGDSVIKTNKDGWRPIHHAADGGLGVLKTFLINNSRFDEHHGQYILNPCINLDLKTPDGRYNPLTIAVNNGDYETALFLCENGANVNAVWGRPNSVLWRSFVLSQANTELAIDFIKLFNKHDMYIPKYFVGNLFYYCENGTINKHFMDSVTDILGRASNDLSDQLSDLSLDQ